MIKSESREETERSTVHNTIAAKSQIPSQKHLDTKESRAGVSAVSGYGGVELNKSINNLDSRNLNEKSMRASFQ